MAPGIKSAMPGPDVYWVVKFVPAVVRSFICVTLDWFNTYELLLLASNQNTQFVCDGAVGVWYTEDWHVAVKVGFTVPPDTHTVMDWVPPHEMSTRGVALDPWAAPALNHPDKVMPLPVTAGGIVITFEFNK